MLAIEGALSSLLNTPTFLPNGGFIDFGSRTSIHSQPAPIYLKGTDVVSAQVCEDLGLSFKLKVVCTDDYQDVWALALEFDGERIVLEYLTEGGYHTKIVFDISKSKYSTTRVVTRTRMRNRFFG
jgi:hypothetical protein